MTDERRVKNPELDICGKTLYDADDGIERVAIAVRNIAEVGNAALKETNSGN